VRPAALIAAPRSETVIMMSLRRGPPSHPGCGAVVIAARRSEMAIIHIRACCAGVLERWNAGALVRWNAGALVRCEN
jgi:hypothetical protein